MMQSRKSGLRALGLSLVAVLGLMGLGASGAQGGWLVAGTELKANESVKISTHAPLSFIIPNFNFEIKCSSHSGLNLKLVPGTLGEGNIQLSECLTISPIGSGKVQKNCKPFEPITVGGRAHLILHSGKNYILLAPPTKGSAFTTVEFPELCTLVETAEVSGSYAVECGHLAAGVFVGLDCGTQQVIQLIRPVPNQGLFGDGLFFGENAATLTGILAAELSGANAGKQWGGHI